MDLRIFRNQAFGEVRVADIGGRPMFAAGDIARALGYANPRDAIAKHCKGVAKCDTPTARKDRVDKNWQDRNRQKE